MFTRDLRHNKPGSGSARRRAGLGLAVWTALSIGLMAELASSAPNPKVQLASIESQRTFAEPIVPVGEPEPGETSHLEEALDLYRSSNNVEAVTPILGFLHQYPNSAWKPSLLANLAVLYRHTGYINRALESSSDAWRMTKQSVDPATKKIADSALATYAELTAALGRTEELATLLDEIRNRPLSGHAAEVVSNARSGLWLMRHDPGGSFRCGPLAVERVSQVLHPGQKLDPKLLSYASTRQGTSLAEIMRLARETGLDLRALKRDPGSPIPVPAVVHWKAGHFAALVEQRSERFLVRDLTFGDDHWISRRAIEEESTGYVLAPREAALPQGWHPVREAEAAAVRGKGATGNPNPGSTPPTAPKKPHLPGDPCAPQGKGMPQYDFHVAVVSLNVTDTPVGYVPPRGPEVSIGITYNSREDFQPATFTFTNIGTRWNFDWLSYVEDDDPNNAGQTIRVAERGGGSFILPHGAGLPAGSYGPNVSGNHETVVRTIQNGVTVSFVRQYPDGGQEVYGQSDNATTMRKYFLTAVSDPFGNTVNLTYDAATLRLLSITDALGQRTTLTYGLAADIYKITAVTDPFGRQAIFHYAGGELQSVTDAAGMTSSFSYGPTSYNPQLASDFMSSMTTPYGTTTFDMGEHPPSNPSDIGNVRWLMATDPAGNQERIEFIHEAAGITDTTTEAVPAGFLNQYLEYRNTFYWSPTAMEQYSDTDPNRYLNATYLFHWLHDATGGPNNVTASSIPESVQAQGQHRIWFSYPNQAASIYQGSLSTPTGVAQVLDTGQEQRYSATYGPSGQIQKWTDPAGRQYSFHYAANGIDLTSIRNDLLNGGQGEQIAAFTYNAAHRPLTSTDYAGQTYSATYNSFGQLTSIRRPDGVTTSITYDAQGFQTQVARTGTLFKETYTYDAANRVRTWTSTDGYTLTLDYDNLDRLTKITYPDGTADSVILDRLDVVESHDRIGRVSRYVYDPADRLIAATDPAGRTTTFSWCGCGALDQLTDPQGSLTSWLRDGLNRVTGEQINGKTTVLYAYDGSGRLIGRRDALNQATGYAYNVDNTLAAVTYQNAVHPTPGVTYQWDFFYPRLAVMNDAFGTTTYTYNPAGVQGAGQLASLTAAAPNHTITFQYDVMGRKTGRTLDGVTVAATYDAEDRVATITSPLGAFTASYDGSSDRLTGLTYPNGQGPTLSYLDAAHDFRISRLRWGTASGSFNLSQFDYTYDAAHDQLLGLTWHDFSNQTGRFFNFAYDDAKRLASRQQTTDPLQPPTTLLHTMTFGYDSADNRTSETIDSTGSMATFNGANQLVAIRRNLTLQALAAIEAARANRQARPAAQTNRKPEGVHP